MQKVLAFIAACQVFQIAKPELIELAGPTLGSFGAFLIAGVVWGWMERVKDGHKHEA